MLDRQTEITCIHVFARQGLSARSKVVPRNNLVECWRWMRLLRPFKFCFHANSLSRNDARAFTLAEILITLGIIGVVAAITIPILMQSLEANQYKVAYKKAYANLTQAFMDASRQNLFVDVASSGTNPNFGGNNANVLTLMNEFKVVKQCTNSDNSVCWDNTGEQYGKSYTAPGRPLSILNSFIDSSGMAWTAIEWYSGRLAVDTNGFKQPNQYGKDRFVFSLVNENKSQDIGIPVKVLPYSDNHNEVCYGNKCGTVGDPDYGTYYGTSWILGK